MLRGIELVTVAQMRAIESAAIASGAVSGLNLMTLAGRAAAGQVRLRWPKAGRALVLCGPGANGGDGYVVARSLAEAGWSVDVLGAAPRAGSDAAAARARWPGAVGPLTVAAMRARPAPDLVVDAILGTGLSRPPGGEILALLRHLQGGPPIMAIDGPSGLCLDSGQVPGGHADDLPRAALTVTFHAAKPGHLLGLGPRLCGRLVVADIGLGAPLGAGGSGLVSIGPRPGMAATEGPWLRKQTVADGHKFSHGVALVVAGPPGSGGAARLGARAALRTGAGLVILAPPAAALPEHAGPPDALMRRTLDDAEALADMLSDRRPMALCLGPGCGVERAGALLAAARRAARPVVLDADALTALAGDMAPLPPDCVLTPHPGEFARLFPDLARQLHDGAPKTRIVAQAARQAGAVVLLKGPDTVIADPAGRVAIHSDGGIPWLATAGAGDVLAGIVTALLARGLSAPEAACLAVRLHAEAARRHGPGLIADDLIEALPGVLRDWPG